MEGGEKKEIALYYSMSTYHNLMGWDMESWFGKGGHRTDQAFAFLFFTSFPWEKVLYTNLLFFFLGGGSGKGGFGFGCFFSVR